MTYLKLVLMVSLLAACAHSAPPAAMPTLWRYTGHHLPARLHLVASAAGMAIARYLT